MSLLSLSSLTSVNGFTRFYHLVSLHFFSVFWMITFSLEAQYVGGSSLARTTPNYLIDDVLEINTGEW